MSLMVSGVQEYKPYDSWGSGIYSLRFLGSRNISLIIPGVKEYIFITVPGVQDYNPYGSLGQEYIHYDSWGSGIYSLRFLGSRNISLTIPGVQEYINYGSWGAGIYSLQFLGSRIIILMVPWVRIIILWFLGSGL